jgi:hypothetical protein
VWICFGLKDWIDVIDLPKMAVREVLIRFVVGARMRASGCGFGLGVPDCCAALTYVVASGRQGGWSRQSEIIVVQGWNVAGRHSDCIL